MQKEIYSFEVNKKVKVDVVEELPDGSKLTKSEEQLKPVKITVKMPGRAEVNDSEFEYAKEYGRLFRAGIMTKEMVKKAYDANNFISEKRERGLQIVTALNDIQNRYQYLNSLSEKGEGEDVELRDLQNQWEALNIELQTLESSVDSIFSNTAEVLAEKHVISYLTLNLTFADDGKFVFKGDNYEAKLKNYDALMAVDEDYYGEIAQKASFVTSLYYTGKATSKEDFDAIFLKEAKNAEQSGENEEAKQDEEAKEETAA